MRIFILGATPSIDLSESLWTAPDRAAHSQVHNSPFLTSLTKPTSSVAAVAGAETPKTNAPKRTIVSTIVVMERSTPGIRNSTSLPVRLSVSIESKQPTWKAEIKCYYDKIRIST